MWNYSSFGQKISRNKHNHPPHQCCITYAVDKMLLSKP